MSDPKPDIDVLSRIMLMQSTLHVIQDETRLGDFICQGLTSVSGVQSVYLCMEGKLVSASDEEIKKKSPAVVPCQCNDKPHTQKKGICCSCLRRTDDEEIVCLPLQTSRQKYGALFLEVVDAGVFELYRAFLQNTANLVALVVENQRNEVRLKKFAADLELQVIERTKQLHYSHQALQESEQRYASAQKAANIGSWEWDMLTNEVTWSETIEPMFGLEPGQFGGTYESFIECVHPDDISFLNESIKQALDNRETAYAAEHRIIRPDQEVRWVLESGDVVLDESGDPVRMVGIVQDITDRKRAEFERGRLLKTLKTKNEELQSIVYVASHDLRSPLVNIQGFNKELYTDCTRIMALLENADIDESVMQEIKPIIEKNLPESMEFIRTSADKMAMLLNGLLQISRVGTADFKLEALDMDQLVGDVVRTFEFQIKRNDITCAVEELPDCQADENQLYQVFCNLVSNAIKYRDPDRPGQIAIRGQVIDGESVYCVEDNGIGIDPAHQVKVFELFHRLNPNDMAGGEGLGLAIVRRIIDRLDGKVHLESEPGRGSKFYIYLPVCSKKMEAVETREL